MYKCRPLSLQKQASIPWLSTAYKLNIYIFFLCTRAPARVCVCVCLLLLPYFSPLRLRLGPLWAGQKVIPWGCHQWKILYIIYVNNKKDVTKNLRPMGPLAIGGNGTYYAYVWPGCCRSHQPYGGSDTLGCPRTLQGPLSSKAFLITFAVRLPAIVVNSPWCGCVFFTWKSGNLTLEKWWCNGI